MMPSRGLQIMFYYAFLIWALLSLLTGCISEKKRLEICRGCTLNQSSKDSTGKAETKLTPFDTTAWIQNRHGKDISLPSNCDSLMKIIAAHNNSISTTQDGIRTTISIQGNKIVARCETDSLKAIIKLLRKEVEFHHFKTITKEVPARCQLEHKSNWDSFFIITGRIYWGLTIFALFAFLLWARFRRSK